MRQKKQSRHAKKNTNKPLNPQLQHITIDSMAHDGRGVGRSDAGKVVFVEGALPSEKVSYHLLEERARFASGLMQEVLVPSEHRVTPRCVIFAKCGGCALQHLTAEQQILYKQQQLLDNLHKIATVQPAQLLTPMVGDAWAYRRRARFGASYAHTKQEVRLGFRARHSHYIQPTTQCDVLDSKVNELLPSVANVLSRLDCREAIQGVEFCVADNTTAIVVQHADMLSHSDGLILTAFAQKHAIQLWIQEQTVGNQQQQDETLGSSNLYCLHPRQSSTQTPLSQPYLQYQLPKFAQTLAFLPTDFIQVNDSINQRLVAKAVELLDVEPNDRVLDLFCGIGNFTLPLATQAQRVLGVEGDEALVQRAKYNQQLNQLENVDFVVADLFADDCIICLLYTSPSPRDRG